jgi:hypothetical protein
MTGPGRISQWIRSNVVGLVALFIALAGTATALPGRSTVTSGDLVAGAVHSSDIHDRGVHSGDIRHHAVSTEDLADGAVTTDKLADFGVTNDKLADRAVDTAVLVENSVTGSKVANDSLTGSDINESSLAPTCNQGGVRGYALVVPSPGKGSGFPVTDYTSDPRFIRETYNCSGQPVEMRNRPETAGSHSWYSTAVRFRGNPARVALVTMARPQAAILGINSSVEHVGPEDRDPNAFVVEQDVRGEFVSGPTYHPFYIVVY